MANIPADISKKFNVAMYFNGIRLVETKNVAVCVFHRNPNDVVGYFDEDGIFRKKTCKELQEKHAVPKDLEVIVDVYGRYNGCCKDNCSTNNVFEPIGMNRSLLLDRSILAHLKDKSKSHRDLLL